MMPKPRLIRSTVRMTPGSQHVPLPLATMSVKFIKSLCIILLIELCICALLIALTRGAPMPTYCSEERIPTWDSVQCYLAQVDTQIVPELKEQLAHIHDKDSARRSIPRLIQLGAACTNMYDDEASYQSFQSESDFIDKVLRLLQQEAAHSPAHSTLYAEVLQEYKRLAQCHFFDDRVLELTLHSYFFGNAGNEVVPLWQPMGMMRSHLLAQHLPISKDAIAKVFTQLYDNYGAHDQRENDISLLFLDYYEHAQIHGRGDFLLLAPAKPTIRGMNAMFDNCFCMLYCFNPRTWGNMHTSSLEEMHPAALYNLNIEKAKQLNAYVGELNDSKTGQITLVYLLSPPFLSTYLILNYNKDAQHPASMTFSNESPLPS